MTAEVLCQYSTARATPLPGTIFMPVTNMTMRGSHVGILIIRDRQGQAVQAKIETMAEPSAYARACLCFCAVVRVSRHTRVHLCLYVYVIMRVCVYLCACMLG
jgi:hypothetical protein